MATVSNVGWCRCCTGSHCGKSLWLPAELRRGGCCKGCQCQGKPHEPIIGKDKSAKAAAYPWAFCRAYAVLAVNHYIKMATVEFYEGRSVLLEGSIRLKKEKAESHDVRPGVEGR